MNDRKLPDSDRPRRSEVCRASVLPAALAAHLLLAGAVSAADLPSGARDAGIVGI